MKLPFRVVLTTLVATVALAACSGNAKKQPPPPPPAPMDNSAMTAPVSRGPYSGPEALDTDSCLRRRIVYFDLDQTDIHPEFQAQIACHAAYLKQFPGARVNLEGNADERGTRDYNQGLGERRGNAVSSALGAAGASTSQVNVVSYGEERPVCREHGESCWQKNRRVEIVYTSKQ